jgi:hypothetical protein|nr:MAG TPA: hypothetical protein [Caudoviricetes sp.]
MSTRKIVPNADNEGGLGTESKRFSSAYVVTPNAGDNSDKVATTKYSDTNLAAAKEYTDEAIKTEQASRSSGDASTLTSAKTYADAAVSTHALISSSSTKSGHIILASSSEAIAGTEETKAITPSTLSDVFKQLLIPLKYPSAASHNALYRGKDLTSYFNSGAMSTAIANGTFDDIYPGDYIIKTVTVNGTTYSNIKWIVGDLDYHLHRGDTETTTHHVVLFPETHLGNARMNASNTTSGGYQGSEMWTTTIPLYATGIINAFGSSHVLVHRERLTKAIDANAYAGGGGMGNGATVYADGEWVNVTANIFNEAMMFGHAPFASSGRDTYDCNKQIAAFRYGQNFTRANWCWLRDVASSISFANAARNGGADYDYASCTDGVRPYFLLH